MGFFKKTFLIAFVVWFFGVLPAHAFTVSPLRGKVSIAPGESQIVVITIKNDGQAKRTYTMTPIGMGQKADGQWYLKQDPSAAAWIQPEVATQTIGAGTSASVHTEVTVPSGTLPGSYAFALQISETAPASGGIGLTPSIAVPLLIDVAGNVTEAITITSWEASPVIALSSHVDGTLAFKNTGTAAVPVSGTMTIEPWYGKAASKTTSLGTLLLPRAERTLFPSIELPYLLPGPVTVTMQIKYGASQSVAAMATTVWYLPWWSWCVVGAIIALIIVIRFKNRKAAV